MLRTASRAGSGVTSFVDTLLTALTKEQAGAMTIVLTEMAAVTIVSLLILALFVALLLVLPVLLLLAPRVV